MRPTFNCVFLRLPAPPPTQVDLNSAPGLVQLLASASSDLRITPTISVLKQQLAAVGGGNDGWGREGVEELGLPDADSILAAAMGEHINLSSCFQNIFSMHGRDLCPCIIWGVCLRRWDV